MYGPVIQGKLALLRPPKPEDAPHMITWFEDMEVTRFLARTTPPSLEMEHEWLEKMARSQDDVLWVVEFEGRRVGVTAIHAIDWKDGHGTTGTTIGDKTVWGKGIGREVMQLRAAYGFVHMPLRKLKSAYFDGNEASAKAQAAAGYRVVGRYRAEHFMGGRYVDMIATELLREDWEKAKSV